MQKILVILGLVVFLAVVEQTSGQICSLNFCRKWPKSNCKCRGCCMGKLGYKYGKCEQHWNFPGPSKIWSCFCYKYPPILSKSSNDGSSGNNGASGSNETTTAPPV